MWLPDAELLRAVLLFATPLMIAALGELIVERSGVVNIGIEGMMLIGALAGWLAARHFGPIAPILGSVISAALAGLLFAAIILIFAADQIVAGAGINLLALGLTGLIYRAVPPQNSVIPPLSPWLAVAFAPVLAAGIWFYLRFTRWGLEQAALGEAPEAVDAAGVSVGRRRLWAILFGSACAGLAGGYLSTMRTQGFIENMTEGQGFLALAIVIFGNWSGAGIVLAALFFGLLRAYADRLIVIGGFGEGTSRLFLMLPYVASLIALAGVAGKWRAPAALGRAYSRE